MRKSGKKLFVWWLTLAMLFTAIPSAVLPAHASVKLPTDIAGHWAKNAVTQWITKEMGSGYPDGTFKPDKAVTRAEFASMANKVFGIASEGETTFSDCKKGTWYYKDIAGAYTKGYISGYKGGSVRPTQAITRQEAAVMLAKLLNLQTDKSSNFSDSSQLSAWAVGAASAVADAGIMQGYSDGSFRGDKAISRAEAVVALSKAVGINSASDQKASATDVIYDKSGTYGGDSLAKTYAGNVTIASEGIILKNAVVKGDLIIDKKVGDGNARIENVKVEGSIYVNGGGQNSVYFVDVTSGKVYVARDDGPVRVVVSGTTDIAEIVAKSTVKVEENDLKNSDGIKNVTVEKGENGAFTVDLSGVKAESVSVKVDGVTVKTDASTKITTFTAESKVAITGQGTIGKLEAKAGGITYEKAPTKTETASGVSSPSQAAGNTASSSSGHGGGGSSVTPAVGAKAMADVAVGAGLLSNLKTVTIKSVTGITGALAYKLGSSSVVNQLSSPAYYATSDASVMIYILDNQGDTLANGTLAVSEAKTSVSFDLTPKVIGPTAIADVVAGSGALTNFKTISLKSANGITGAVNYKVGSSAVINRIGNYVYYVTNDATVPISILDGQNNVIATGILPVSGTKAAAAFDLTRKTVVLAATADVLVGAGPLSNLKAITVQSISGIAGAKYRIGNSSVINQTGSVIYCVTDDSNVTIYILDSQGKVAASGVLLVSEGKNAVNIALTSIK